MAKSQDDRKPHYTPSSLTLWGAVSMGTGVMIGAGIFALTGQIAELASQWFPLAILAAAIVTAFSAFSYVKLANAYPSAGGIAMLLHKIYGKTTWASIAINCLLYYRYELDVICSNQNCFNSNL